MEGYRCSPQRIFLFVLIDLSVFVYRNSPGITENRASLPGNLLDSIGAVGQLLGCADPVLASDDGIHHDTLAVCYRELSTHFRDGQVINGVYDHLGELDFAGDNGFGTTGAIGIAEAVILLFLGHGEALLPLLVKQVTGGRCRFSNCISTHGENVFCLGMALGIGGQHANNLTGRIDFTQHNHRIGAAVDHLIDGSGQGCFALGSLPGDGIKLVDADRAEQIGVDRLIYTPIAICHLCQNGLGFFCPDVLCAAGLGTVHRNGAVQGAGNHSIAKRIFDLCDFHSTQGELIDICRRYIEGITGIAGSQIILAVDTSAACVGSKVPYPCGGAAPIVVGEVFPLENRTGESGIALGSGGVLVHLGQHKGRVKDGNIGHRDQIFTGSHRMGVGLGVQFESLGCLGFLDGQNIPDVILLGRGCVAVGIGHKGFHYLAVQRNGVFSASQRVQRIALNLIDTALGSIDRFLEGHRLGIFRIGQCNIGGLDAYGNLLDLYLTGAVHIDLVPLRRFGFLHKVCSTVEARPLTLAVCVRFADTCADIARIRGRQAGIVSTGNGSGAGGVTVKGKFRTCQISGACGVGLGQTDAACAFAVRCPVPAQVIKSVGAVFCRGINLCLDAVHKASSKQLVRSSLFPNRGAVVGAVLAAQHQLTDHGVRGLFHPGTGFKSGVAVGSGGVGSGQPVFIGAGRGCHITDGIDPVCAAQVFRSHIRPNDGGDQSIAVLGHTQLAVVGIQIVLNGLITGSKVFQSGSIQRGVRCHSFTLGNVQLIPCAVVAAKDNMGQIVLDCLAAAVLVADNPGIGRCASTGIFVVKPVACKSRPCKGASVTGKILIGEMIYIGVRIPSCLNDEGMGRNGVGVKNGGHGFALVLAGIIPGDRLSGLDSVNDTSVGIVAVVAIIVSVVDHLHGHTYRNHVAGAIACGVAAAVTTAADLGAGAAAVIVTGRTCGEHHCSLRFFRRLGSGIGFRRLSFRFHCFGRGSGRLCFFRRRFFCFGRRLCLRRSCFLGFAGDGGILRRGLGIVDLCGKCCYCAQRETRNRQCEYQQKRHDFFHCVQFGFLLWGNEKVP